jgi:hypothetical protein
LQWIIIKPSGYYGTYMQVLQGMQNAYGYFRLICGYCIFENGVYNREWCTYDMFKMCGLF